MSNSQNSNLVLSAEKLGDEKYWFIRTDGGAYYDQFSSGNYIAISYNKLPYYLLQEYFTQKTIGKPLRDLLLPEIFEKPITPEELKNKENQKKLKSRTTAILNQNYAFIREISKGDIVIIPSEKSRRLNFGRVIDDITYIPGQHNYPGNLDGCPFEKRRRIEWIQEKKITSVDDKLINKLRNPHAINEVSNLRDLINREFSDFFISEEKLHVVIRVKMEGEIPLSTYELLTMAENLAIKLGNKLNIQMAKKSIKIKTNVQSPGVFELFSDNYYAIVLFMEIMSIVMGTKTAFRSKNLKAVQEIEDENKSELESIREMSDEIKLVISSQFTDAVKDKKG